MSRCIIPVATIAHEKELMFGDVCHIMDPSPIGVLHYVEGRLNMPVILKL
jgi:hypothetical protein